MAQILIVNGKLRLRNGRIALAGGVALPSNPPVPSEPETPPTSGVTVALVSDVKNQQVYQRVGTSKQVPVAVTYSGGQPSAIEARVVDATTFAAASAWQVIDPAPANGAGAGLLTVPQGCWYLLEVRAAGGAVTRGVNKFGVGAVIGLIGQSNMVNFVGSGDTYPVGHPNSIYFSATSTYLRIGNTSTTNPPNHPTSTGNMVSGSVRGGGPVYLANMLTMELGVPVLLVDKPVGGSNIASWTDGTVGNNWSEFKDKLILAGGDMEACFWYQGESNAYNATEAYMQERWGVLYAQCLAQTGRTTDTFKMGMISLGPGSYVGSTEGEFGQFRVWQRDYSKAAPGWFYAAAAHASGSSTDHVHVGGHANRGRYMARSYLALKGYGVPGAGPFITGATRSGLVVTLAVTHSGGTALKDGASGTGSALTGYRFFDAGAGGAQIAYTATAIVDNSIQITLASAPIGALTFDYAITDVPHGAYYDNGSGDKGMTFDAATCVYDNVAMPNMTYGFPLQPCAAMAVTGA